MNKETIELRNKVWLKVLKERLTESSFPIVIKIVNGMLESATDCTGLVEIRDYDCLSSEGDVSLDADGEAYIKREIL